MDDSSSFYRVALSGEQVAVSYAELAALRKDILRYFDDNLGETTSLYMPADEFTLPYWEYLSLNFAQQWAESVHYQRLVEEGCLALLNGIALELVDEPVTQHWREQPRAGSLVDCRQNCTGLLQLAANHIWCLVKRSKQRKRVLSTPVFSSRIPAMLRRFLLDPDRSGPFYLLLFIALIAAALFVDHAFDAHYGVIGSVASFLGLFTAFQSWKAAHEASRHADQALAQMQQVTRETQALAHSNHLIDQQIRLAVTTISDATRELHKGYQPVLAEVAEFLEKAAGSEYLAVMTDTAAFGKFFLGCQPSPPPRELHALTDRIHELLLERVRDAREFYLASLAAEDEPGAFPPAGEANSLFTQFAQPVWQHLRPGEVLPEADWEKHRRLHVATLRQVQETFELFSAHEAQKTAGVGPLLPLSVLPLQLLIRVDAEAPEPFRALVIFVGQYNLNRLPDARAMHTADPELVRTFLSMFESIAGLDGHAGYQKLRAQWPL
jgi:hypothetical protein